MDDKSLFKISAIFLVLLLLIATEYFITSYKVTQLSNLQEKVFEKYHLKSTMFQNKAMFKELQAKHKEQMQLRKNIAIVLKLSLKKEQKLTLIEIKGKKLKLVFEGEKEALQNVVFAQLKKEQIKYNAHYKKNSLYMELSL